MPVAEALLGTQILEDLGVPEKFLGAATQLLAAQERAGPMSAPRTIRWFVAKHIGLMPLAALVMLFIFLIYFRNGLAVLLPLPGVVATLLFVFGLMGWFGVPIYLTAAVMPVLLVVLSVTNDIYLFNRYFRLLRENPARNHVELLGETFEKLARPVAATSLAAVIGFTSFGFSPLVPVRAFGLFTGVGALFGLVFSLTAVPALLVLVNPNWLRPRKNEKRNFAVTSLGTVFVGIGKFVVCHRWPVVATTMAVMVLTPLSLRRLMVQDSWTNGFDPQGEFRQVAAAVDNNFFGMYQLLVVFDAPEMLTGDAPASVLHPGRLAFPIQVISSPALLDDSPINFSVKSNTHAGDAILWRTSVQMPGRAGDRLVFRLPFGNLATNFWDALASAGQAHYEIVVHSQMRPEILRAGGEFENFIRQRSRDEVGGVLGPWDYVTTTAFIDRPNDPSSRRLPDDADRIKTLWNFYGMTRGERRLREVVDTNYWRSLTTVFLKDANFVGTARLMGDIRKYEREQLAPKGIKLVFAGDVAVSQSLIRGIVSTQLQSLIWSLLGIFAVATALGGSVRWGLYCLLPSLLAVVIKFAVMGWADIPLGVATSMFAAMTLGIGVNCTIHLLEGFSQARAAGKSPPDALRQSLRLTGPPALINTLAVSLGFGVLMLSQVPANARLGLLLVLGLVNCFVASLLLLPVLIHWWPLANFGKAKPVHPQADLHP
ncbi:MAG: efflux RND transporter permease subunit [Limisphaerales bacterium]